jgi:phosphoenolpyruvate carboxylase
LELYLSAVTEAASGPAPRAPKTWRKVMDDLSERSAAIYRRTVYEDADFVRYFRTVTPEPELALMKIGSRPASRGGDPGLASLRAIPWVFAWMQTRLLLPAWLGVGEALASTLQGTDRQTLVEMAEQWPFFRTTLDLVEMVLAKAAPWVFEHYHAVLADTGQQDRARELCDRYQRTCAALLETVGREGLLDGNRVLQRSIRVRNPYVDPINLVQVEILRRIRGRDPAADLPDHLRDAFAVTANGIAAGMRNTG